MPPWHGGGPGFESPSVQNLIMEKYDHKKIESKWQKYWEEKGLYKASDDAKEPKYYCLDMFPYPSGEGLHVGHWRGIVLSDVIARYQLLNGKNVLHPMGWDAFGLPAENAAIKNNSHPAIYTKKAISNMKRQIKQIGTMIDWSREINTSDPNYYKWTQWIFLKLYKNGLAYRKKAPVNWCLSCKTVLANEQVIGGKCERCDSIVNKKELTQWFFKITQFAEELLADLDKLDWPERTKTLQRNWIGKSEGALVKFKIHNFNESIEVFTTRPDTLAGSTFMVLAPEHMLVDKITTNENKEKVLACIEKVKKESEIERASADKEKTGVFTGSYAINPINFKKIPIWISDYVLLSYGTGAVMCVPAHDQRDFDFAKKFKLETIQVISKSKIEETLQKAYLEEGYIINSGKYDGLKNLEAKDKIIADLESKNLAEKAVNYRLRDWLISRQRYWGVPIPIIYCDKCGEVAVNFDDLPVKLPEDVVFHPSGESPFKSSESFINTKCPSCGGQALRETDTMDTFVCSSWYYLRYCDSSNIETFASKENISKWMPVDFYVGGIEHAILHLLYARFISKALFKLKLLSYDNGEPFKKLFNIGMVYLHGSKMSKSKGNIVSPDDLIEKYGTDALRGYELFIGPADLDSEWQVLGISGIYRFIEKVWHVYNKNIENDYKDDPEIEKTIKVATLEIESLRPNTAISHLMELFNKLKKTGLSKENAKRINIIIAPFFPHLAEEIWSKQDNNESVFKERWPEFDEKLTQTLKVKIPIQINGKVRSVIEIDAESSEEEVKNMALANDKIKNTIGKRKIKKIIYIPSRIINFVIE